MHFPAAVTPAVADEPGILFVAVLGIGIVMLGLICLILLCKLMSAVCRHLTGETDTESTPAPAAVFQPAPIPNREELLAAVTATIAEELGTDVSAIRVRSFRSLEAPSAQTGTEAVDRGELVAAITAAVAEELGTDVSALRVHSLRQLS